jgi:very-short-patch-repair endonuclease
VTDPKLFALAEMQGGVFSARQAREAGIAAAELERARRRGTICALRRGIFVPAQALEGIDVRARHRLDIAGASLVRNEHRAAGDSRSRRFAAGHRSAGLMWGLPSPPPKPSAWHTATGGGAIGTPGTTPLVVELVSHGRGGRTHRFGVSECPAALPAEHLVLLEGIPVTTAARTAADLMRGLDWEHSVFVADAVLHAGTSRPELESMVRFMSIWPGGCKAVRACEFANGAAESVAESLARIVMAEAGLPEAELQTEIWHGGRFIARVDFLFRASRVIVEIDGRIKYTDPHGPPGEVLWREKQREDRLREAGYEVVRVTWAQLTQGRAEVAVRIRAAFARAQARAS